MKKHVLIASLFFVAYLANAQVNSLPIIGNKFTFGINGGLSMPSGDYGSTTSSSSGSNISGFAKTGFYYDAYAGFKFSKFIGIMVQYGGNSNASGIANASGGFTVRGYLAGPYLSITLLKIKIEAKLLAGIVTSNFPTQTLYGATINSYTGIINYNTPVIVTFQNGSGFGYCAGVKAKYMLIGGMLGIGVGLNYVGSDVKYNSLTENGVPQPNTSTKMSIGIVQATLGLSLDI